MNEHICQECGLCQTVDEYENNPEFVVSEMESEIIDANTFAVTADIGVRKNEYFECEACGNIINFDSSVVETSISCTKVWDCDIEMHVAERRAVAKVKRDLEEQPEDFL